MTRWRFTGGVRRSSCLVLALLCLVPSVSVAGAAAQTTTATTPTVTTGTDPEQVGQDLSDSGQAPASDSGQAPAAASSPLPTTGWRGRDSVLAGFVLLAAGFALRRATLAPQN